MNDSTKEAGIPKGKPELIRIDEGEIRSHLDQIVRGTVEETLNALLEAEADAICRALSSALKELEASGLILRKEYPQVPPRVEYSLPPKGLSLIPLMEQMCEWGKANRE